MPETCSHHHVPIPLLWDDINIYVNFLGLGNLQFAELYSQEKSVLGLFFG